jgi:hypothetical protein
MTLVLLAEKRGRVGRVINKEHNLYEKLSDDPSRKGSGSILTQ